MKVKKICAAAMALLLAASVSLFVGCDRAGGVRVLSLATASLGGTYFIVGSGLAEAINAAVPNMIVNAVIAPGSVGNPLLLGNNEVDLAMTNYLSAYNAIHGNPPFAAAIPLAGIAPLQFSMLQFLVFDNSGIHSVSDLRGQRVNIGPPGGGGALLFNQLLPFWGLEPGDVSISFLSYAEGSEGMSDGRMDVNVPHGAPPLGAISSLAAFNDVRLLNLETDILAQIVEQFPYYSVATVPAGTYRGIYTDVQTIGIQDILVIRKDADEEEVFQITRAIYEAMEALRQLHPSLAYMTFEGFRHDLVPLHPGALRFYRERNIRIYE